MKVLRWITGTVLIAPFVVILLMVGGTYLVSARRTVGVTGGFVFIPTARGIGTLVASFLMFVGGIAFLALGFRQRGSG